MHIYLKQEYIFNINHIILENMKCMCLGNLFNFLKKYINSTYYTKMFLKHGNEKKNKKNKMIFKLSLKLTKVEVNLKNFHYKIQFSPTIIFNLKNIVDLFSFSKLL